MCAPARAGLITGRYPQRTGCIDTLDLRGLDRLAPSEVTVADLFRAGGYTTGLIGKWHNGRGESRYHPTARGFDEFVGFAGGWSNYYEYTLDAGGSPRRSDGTYMTDVLAQEAIDFIRRHKSEPFFLHVAFNAPHWPLQCPDEDVAPFLETGKYSRELSILYGMILRMDKGIGRILEALDELGLAENTIVVFTSDNGPDFESGGRYWGGPDVGVERYNAGFRGHKYLVYEGGIRVPGIVRWPDGLAGVKRCDQLWHFTDWMPTLLAAAGVELPRDLRLDGLNLLPVLRGEHAPVDVVRFWQWNRYTPLATCNAAVRDGAWKLVRPAIDKAMQVLQEDVDRERAVKAEGKGVAAVDLGPLPVIDVGDPPSPQLYNLEEDPFEERDLAAEHPDRVARMLAMLETWYESVESDRRRTGGNSS